MGLCQIWRLTRSGLVLRFHNGRHSCKFEWMTNTMVPGTLALAWGCLLTDLANFDGRKMREAQLSQAGERESPGRPAARPAQQPPQRRAEGEGIARDSQSSDRDGRATIFSAGI